MGAEEDYKSKPSLYYEQSRPEMLPFVPSRCRRLLDVGCGDGSFGALVKSARQIEVWGVEPFESAAALASSRLDRVIHGAFDARVALPAGHFDCVTFNDVLEHLLDPAAALQQARSLLGNDGVIVASIPNIRHFPTMWHLAIHGEWRYRDCGTLDKTHLRFFTRSSILDLFAEAGMNVVAIQGMHQYRGIPNTSTRVWRLFKTLNWLSGKKFSDCTYERFAVVAQIDSGASGARTR